MTDHDEISTKVNAHCRWALLTGDLPCRTYVQLPLASACLRCRVPIVRRRVRAFVTRCECVPSLEIEIARERVLVNRCLRKKLRRTQEIGADTNNARAGHRCLNWERCHYEGVKQTFDREI